MLEPGRRGKWVHLRYILKVERTGPADGFNSGSEDKGRRKDDSPGFWIELSVPKMGKTQGEGDRFGGSLWISPSRYHPHSVHFIWDCAERVHCRKGQTVFHLCQPAHGGLCWQAGSSKHPCHLSPAPASQAPACRLSGQLQSAQEGGGSWPGMQNCEGRDGVLLSVFEAN